MALLYIPFYVLLHWAAQVTAQQDSRASGCWDLWIACDALFAF